MPNEQKPGYIKTQPTTKPPQQKTQTQAKVPRKIGENKSVKPTLSATQLQMACKIEMIGSSVCKSNRKLVSSN